MLLSRVKNWIEPSISYRSSDHYPQCPQSGLSLLISCHSSPIGTKNSCEADHLQLLCVFSWDLMTNFHRSGVNESSPHMTWESAALCTCSKIALCRRLLNSVHLQPLDGLLAARAEHDAVVQAGDGSCTAGQCWQRRRGTHPRHGIGHCGEIIPLIHSLAFTVIVLVIGQVCQGGTGARHVYRKWSRDNQ